MNLISLFTESENNASAQQSQPGTRREALKWLGKTGAKAAVAALPLNLGQVLAANAAPAAATVAEALQLALKLARLQAEFYTKALTEGTSTIAYPTAGSRTAVEKLQSNEQAHVNLLLDALTGLGEAPEPKPDFDFTLNGQYAGVFASYSEFLAVAQTLEDGTVRTLKGLVSEFTSDKDLLKTVIGLHGTQARHAGQVRNMRRLNGETSLRPWITAAEAHNTPAQVYAGEETTVQLGVAVPPLPAGTSTVGDIAATQAFDEPFTTAEATAFLALFVA